jgi:helicase MOV-10
LSCSIVKLVKNFRSHPQILDFPNRTFYGGDLQAHADSQVVDTFVQWRHPVMFHAIAGNDEREASSPSYFNRLEASQVKNYVQLLLAGGQVGSYERDQLLYPI